MDEAGKWRWIDVTLAVIAAVVVAYGVLFLGWSVFVVIALFWLENVVIGVFNVAKMLITGARIGGAGLIAALALAAFFTVHYGGFTVGHGVFVFMLFGQSELGGSMSGLFAPLGRMLDYLLAERNGWLAAAGIVALQSAAFVHWWGVSRPHATTLPHLMFAPYGRIVVLHVTVIASGILIGILKLPVLGALFLVALKLTFDIAAISNVTFSRGTLRARRLIVAREDNATHP